MTTGKSRHFWDPQFSPPVQGKVALDGIQVLCSFNRLGFRGRRQTFIQIYFLLNRSRSENPGRQRLSPYPSPPKLSSLYLGICLSCVTTKPSSWPRTSLLTLSCASHQQGHSSCFMLPYGSVPIQQYGLAMSTLWCLEGIGKR